MQVPCYHHQDHVSSQSWRFEQIYPGKRFVIRTLFLQLHGEGLRSFIHSMRINQLPVSAARWQHGSQIWFQFLYGEKLQNYNNLKTTEATKNGYKFGISRIFKITFRFNNCLSLLSPGPKV